MLLLKSFHIIAMVAWFAGLFYLPRLFVYHAQISSKPEHLATSKLFCTMERKLYWYIMTPAGLLTIIFGLSLIHKLGHSFFIASKWLHIKLSLVSLLIVFHCYCGICLQKFKNNTNQYSEKFYRYFNEVPTIILISVVILSIFKF